MYGTFNQITYDMKVLYGDTTHNSMFMCNICNTLQDNIVLLRKCRKYIMCYCCTCKLFIQLYSGG